MNERAIPHKNVPRMALLIRCQEQTETKSLAHDKRVKGA